MNNTEKVKKKHVNPMLVLLLLWLHSYQNIFITEMFLQYFINETFMTVILLMVRFFVRGNFARKYFHLEYDQFKLLAYYLYYVIGDYTKIISCVK